MTQQIINIGTSPNSGDGDPLRTAFTKSNENFTELYGYSVDLSGVSNATQARTNLGLGSIATQNSAAVAITGGSIEGTPIGSTVPTTGDFSSLSVAGISYPTTDGTTGQVLQTDGVGTLSFLSLGSMAGQDSAAISISGGTIDNVTIGGTTAASGTFSTLSTNSQAILAGLAYPTTDGTAGQVLSTDGTGTLSWTNNAGGLGAVVDDPSPQLGGDLNVNGHSIVSATNGDIVLSPNGTGEVKFANTVNLQDNMLEGAEFRDYAEALVTEANSGTAYSIDLSAGNVLDLTLTDSCTLSIVNPPATGRSGSLTLILRQDGTGSRAVTWPSGTQWAGGTAPTLSASANAVDVLTFFTVDGGGVWFGFLAGANMQ